MADLTITTLRVVADYESHSLPCGEALGLGAPAYANTSTGKAWKADANVLGSDRVLGLNVKATIAANLTAHLLRRGLIYIDGLGSVVYGQRLWLSATAGAISDTDPGVNERQTLTITGTPTGGTFTLTFRGATTAAIAYNATAAVVQAALEAIATIGSGNVICAGGALPGAAVTIDFVHKLGQQNVDAMTADIALLTGGSPAYTIAETVAGVGSVLLGRVIPLWDQSTPSKIVSVNIQ